MTELTADSERGLRLEKCYSASLLVARMLPDRLWRFLKWIVASLGVVGLVNLLRKYLRLQKQLSLLPPLIPQQSFLYGNSILQSDTKRGSAIYCQDQYLKYAVIGKSGKNKIMLDYYQGKYNVLIAGPLVYDTIKNTRTTGLPGFFSNFMGKDSVLLQQGKKHKFLRSIGLDLMRPSALKSYCTKMVVTIEDHL